MAVYPPVRTCSHPYTRLRAARGRWGLGGLGAGSGEGMGGEIGGWGADGGDGERVLGASPTACAP